MTKIPVYFVVVLSEPEAVLARARQIERDSAGHLHEVSSDFFLAYPGTVQELAAKLLDESGGPVGNVIVLEVAGFMGKGPVATWQWLAQVRDPAAASAPPGPEDWHPAVAQLAEQAQALRGQLAQEGQALRQAVKTGQAQSLAQSQGFVRVLDDRIAQVDQRARRAVWAAAAVSLALGIVFGVVLPIVKAVLWGAPPARIEQPADPPAGRARPGQPPG